MKMMSSTRMSKRKSYMKVFNAMAVMYSLSREYVTSAASAKTLITVKPVKNVLVMNIRSSR